VADRERGGNNGFDRIAVLFTNNLGQSQTQSSATLVLASDRYTNYRYSYNRTQTSCIAHVDIDMNYFTTTDQIVEVGRNNGQHATADSRLGHGRRRLSMRTSSHTPPRQCPNGTQISVSQVAAVAGGGAKEVPGIYLY
jgi:hypothetical protein